MRRNCFLAASMCFPLLLSGAVLADTGPAAVKQLITKDLLAAQAKKFSCRP